MVTGGLYRHDALRAGQEVLERASLVKIVDDVIFPVEDLQAMTRMPQQDAVEMLFRALVLQERPLWLWGLVDERGLHLDNVPDDAASVLSKMMRTVEEREAYLLSLARTVDTQQLKELGLRGEELVVATCRAHLSDRGRSDLADLVCRVSEISDELGYDITSIDTGGTRHRLEVKATRVAVNKFEFYLSRNEADFAARDRNWSLVAVCLDGDDRVLGWCRSEALAPHLPVDTSEFARWASVKVSMPLADLTPGLPLDARTGAH